MLTLARLQSLVDLFPQRRLGLVGDLFLDRYLELEEGTSELSIETGLEAYQIGRIRNQPGALGTVIGNLSALGAGRILPLTVIGEDGHGFDLLKSLEPLPVDPSWIIQSPRRLTPTYTKPLRPVDESWVELNRLDVRTRDGLSEIDRDEVCRQLSRLYDECDGLIVLDQMNSPESGVICSAVRETLETLDSQNKIVYIDSRCNLSAFRTGILKGNESEICRASPADSVQASIVQLAGKTGAPVICTQGDQGCTIGYPTGELNAVAGVRVPGPIDIVGAGDAATSGIMLTALSGASLDEAAVVGNLVASITVQQIGTTGTATPQQVIDRWHDWDRQVNSNQSS